MLHPHTALKRIDDEIGYGVFATRPIPRGTITWAFDLFDQVYTPQEVHAMDEMHQGLIAKYAYRDSRGYFILCWDFGRYINHSFDSNCMATGYDFEIAIRDIQAGEELTNDYGYLNMQSPFKARETKNGRAHVFPDDLVHYHKEWDALIQSSLPFMLKVDQPLGSLIPKHDMAEIKETIAGKREMKSILSHYCAK